MREASHNGEGGTMEIYKDYWRMGRGGGQYRLVKHSLPFPPLTCSEWERPLNTVHGQSMQ